MADVTKLVRTVVAGVLATTAVLCGAATASAATPGEEWEIRGAYHQSPDLNEARALAEKDTASLIAQCVAKNGSYVRDVIWFRETFDPTGWKALAAVTCRQN